MPINLSGQKYIIDRGKEWVCKIWAWTLPVTQNSMEREAHQHSMCMTVSSVKIRRNYLVATCTLSEISWLLLITCSHLFSLSLCYSTYLSPVDIRPGHVTCLGAKSRRSNGCYLNPSHCHSIPVLWAQAGLLSGLDPNVKRERQSHRPQVLLNFWKTLRFKNALYKRT